MQSQAHVPDDTLTQDVGTGAVNLVFPKKNSVIQVKTMCQLLEIVLCWLPACMRNQALSLEVW